MWENLVFFVLLFIFSVVFMIKRVPIIGVPFGIVVFFISAIFYLPLGEFDTLFSILLMFMGAMCVFVNAIMLRR